MHHTGINARRAYCPLASAPNILEVRHADARRGNMPEPLGPLRARGLGADECGIFIDTAETSAWLVAPDAKTKPDWFCLARKCFSYRVRVRKWTPGLQFTLTWPEPVQVQQLWGPLDQIVHLLTPGGGVVRSSGGDGFTPSEASPEVVFELTRPTTLVSSSFTMQGGGSIDVHPTVTCAAMTSAPAPPPRGLDCDLLPHYRVKNKWDAGLVAELRFERWEQDRLVTLQYPGTDAVGMFDVKNAFPESSSTFSTSFQFRLRLGNPHPPDECAAECRSNPGWRHRHLRPLLQGRLLWLRVALKAHAVVALSPPWVEALGHVTPLPRHLPMRNTQVLAEWLLRRAWPSAATSVPFDTVQVVPIPPGTSGGRRPQDHLPPAMAATSTTAPTASASALSLPPAAAAAFPATEPTAAATAAVVAAVGVRDGVAPSTAAAAGARTRWNSG